MGGGKVGCSNKEHTHHHLENNGNDEQEDGLGQVKMMRIIDEPERAMKTRRMDGEDNKNDGCITVGDNEDGRAKEGKSNEQGGELGWATIMRRMDEPGRATTKTRMEEPGQATATRRLDGEGGKKDGHITAGNNEDGWAGAGKDTAEDGRAGTGKNEDGHVGAGNGNDEYGEAGPDDKNGQVSPGNNDEEDGWAGVAMNKMGKGREEDVRAGSGGGYKDEWA